jgi:hypothetical protein
MGLIDIAPKHQDFGIQSAKLITPGHPEQSILLQRIAKRDKCPQSRRTSSIRTLWI